MIPSKEDSHTEFKTSFNEEVIVSLAAFANAKGGTVYVGVNDKGEPVGVELGQESVAKWINEIKQKMEPSIIPDVEILEIKGSHVVALGVQEWPVKPVSARGRYYCRQGNSNQMLSAGEIADMILQSRNVSWDSYPRFGSSYSMLSEYKIKAFVAKVNAVRRFRMPESPMDALSKLGMLVDGVPTNAAYLLFAEEDPHYNVHIGRFKTPSMIIADKMISGTLFEVLEEAMQTIVGHLKFAFDIKVTGVDTRRKEIPEYPLEAIRELLLNAIVHRDYQSPTDVQIKIFDHAISFFNPSGLYGNITVEDLATDAYQASTRNKQIAESFYLVNEIEKYGSGFIRIRNAIREYPTMKFSYRDMGYGFLAELSYDIDDGASIGNKEEIVAETKSNGKKTTKKTTKKTSEKILALLRQNGMMTLAEIASECGISKDGIYYHIKKLKTSGFIERIGPDKGGYWRVVGSDGD